MNFKVSKVLNYNTLKLSEPFTYKSIVYDTLIVRGLEIKDANFEKDTFLINLKKNICEHRLAFLLLEKQVVLFDGVDKGVYRGSNLLECSIRLNGVDIMTYFPDFVEKKLTWLQKIKKWIQQ